MLKETGDQDARGIWRCAAADRNKGPIAGVLANVLPEHGTALEIASGTGQHVVHFAATFPALRWQPTEPDADLRASIRAHIAAAGAGNVNAPMALDVMDFPWPLPGADAMVATNLLHVAPWPATAALFRGAAAVLSPGGPLLIYGPFHRGGQPTSDGNRAFDRQLRETNPVWGIRDLEAIEAAAAAHGFTLAEIIGMPANNFSLIFRKPGRGHP